MDLLQEGLVAIKGRLAHQRVQPGQIPGLGLWRVEATQLPSYLQTIIVFHLLEDFARSKFLDPAQHGVQPPWFDAPLGMVRLRFDSLYPDKTVEVTKNRKSTNWPEIPLTKAKHQVSIDGNPQSE